MSKTILGPALLVVGLATTFHAAGDPRQQSKPAPQETSGADMHMDHRQSAVYYENEARALDARADRHADLSRQYLSRSRTTAKQSAPLRSLSMHCDDLASAYKHAAAEARKLAATHRELESHEE